MSRDILDFYGVPGRMTSVGAHLQTVQELPNDVAALARIIHGLMLHEHWAPAYGQTLSEERRMQAHLRPAESMLDWLLAEGGQALSVCRPLEDRIVGTCRDYAVLLVALLKAKGVPARARCGFGTYFESGRHVDHWVTEYWSETEERWRMVDAQIDDFQRVRLPVEIDPLDINDDQFIVAGKAWLACRAGDADPSMFGIMDMTGLWFISGNVMRDLASLNRMEMLPWDDWGEMIGPDEEHTPAKLEVLDRAAQAISDPDTSFDEIQALYASDNVRVPTDVFNAVLGRVERV